MKKKIVHKLIFTYRKPASVINLIKEKMTAGEYTFLLLLKIFTICIQTLRIISKFENKRKNINKKLNT